MSHDDYSNQRLYRRAFLALGFASVLTQLPGLVKLTSPVMTTDEDPVSAKLSLRFPDGYDHARFEYENPNWVDLKSFREFSDEFSRSGKLIGFRRSSTLDGVDYVFKFKTRSDFEAFFIGIRDKKLVDFEKRSQIGISARLQVNDGTIWTG